MLLVRGYGIIAVYLRVTQLLLAKAHDDATRQVCRGTVETSRFSAGISGVLNPGTHSEYYLVTGVRHSRHHIFGALV